MAQATARPRPKVMTLTDAAAARVQAIIARSDTPVVGLRIGVKNGGCAGMEYTMDWATEQKPFDEVIEEKGVKVLIDPKAILFLLGTGRSDEKAPPPRAAGDRVRKELEAKLAGRSAEDGVGARDD